MKVCFNGTFFPLEKAIITAQNRSFKWGDGCFETMKVFKGKLMLKEMHFERLFVSLQLLQIERNKDFTENTLESNILELCTQNGCINSSRIRLAVYRNEDNSAGYLIEAIGLDETTNSWQINGQSISLFPYARKSVDTFANIKSANFLPYVMAKKFAEENQLDDVIVLNGHSRLADTSKANIFLIKQQEIFTPALHEGCINGVMRRVVIEQAKKLGYRLHVEGVTEEELLMADEVFLTNAIQIIRWVAKYKNATYGYTETKKIFNAVAKAIFSQ